jgi:23S rRNA (pseudouridine1915-N3)-methyltransferase
LSSRGLAEKLAVWQADGRNLCFVIGGPDGVSDACRRRADFTWSLSELTLPHGLARVLLAEQLYRAHSLQVGHPYHRE